MAGVQSSAGYPSKEASLAPDQTEKFGCRDSTSGLAAVCFALPDVADAMGAACCNPALLARLGIADLNLRQLIFSRRFAERRAQDFCDHGIPWAKGCVNLEQLAVGLKVMDVCASDSSNHLYFEYGGGLSLLEETKKLIHAAALFAQQHPRLKFHVDAHAGAGAPRGIATSTARRRALSVVDELVGLGVAREHVSTTAWGRRISSVWLEPESSTAARAELYFSLDGQEFPTRPDYYKLRTENKADKKESNDGNDAHNDASNTQESTQDSQTSQTSQSATDFSDSEEDEEDRPHVRRQRMLAMLRALGFPFQGTFQGSDGRHVILLARRDDNQESSDQEG